MAELLDRFKPILVIASAHTADESLISDCKQSNIDFIQPKPLKPAEITDIIEKYKHKQV